MGCVSSSQVSPETAEERAAIASLARGGFKLSSEKDVNKHQTANHNKALRQCPIHVACANGDIVTARWLASKGANLRAQNSYQQTPLMLACEQGNIPLADFLFESGAAADLHESGCGGTTALHLAVHRRQHGICSWVLSKAPDGEGREAAAKRRDNHGDTPLMLVVSGGCPC